MDPTTILATTAPLTFSYLFTDSSWTKDRRWYDSLNKSPLNPPNWTFGVVWPILYLMMGYAHSLIISQFGFTSLPGLLYLAQLFLNITWSNIFFIEHKVGMAFGQILTTIVLVGYLTYLLWDTNRTAAYLLIPYLLWLTFASYLNGYIYFNNADQESK